MRSLKTICVALCAALVLVGCNMNNTAKGTAIGAGGGAVGNPRSDKADPAATLEKRHPGPGRKRPDSKRVL